MEQQSGDRWASPDQQTPAPYTGVERRRRTPLLSMRLRDFTVDECVDYMLTTPRSARDGVGLFVTPNIQHVAAMRSDPEFAAAMQGAQIIVCDGFPVFRYAQMRGQSLPGRVTGRDVVARMMADMSRLEGHRVFLIVDTQETATAIRDWLAALAPTLAVETLVPPFGFGNDPAYCADLVGRIGAFGTTLLFLCVGAPQSEVFVHRYRALLTPCWALCVGQSFKIVLGITAMPPALMVKLNLEWLWRIMLEPKRMIARYGPSSVGFLASVLTDLRRRR
ncbi:WecB/TagA/CpsF family glycosyltransferase [Sphingomonas faeni]|uniref:WecB/TagA/CpsF family glycosyltransferase n=1 Tax=Sphingomonas faeni TaxID=185950 RepID=UPI0033547E6A